MPEPPASSEPAKLPEPPKPSEPGKLSEAQAFHLEEYKALRKEIEINMTESRAEERYLVIAVGVIWAWLIVNRNGHLVLWSIPLLLSAASLCRVIAMDNTIQGLGGYLKSLESHFNTPGWESEIRREKSKELTSFKGKITIGLTNFIVSIALLILAVVGLFEHENLTAASAPPPATCVCASQASGRSVQN